jgi:hypothetical protein
MGLAACAGGAIANDHSEISRLVPARRDSLEMTGFLDVPESAGHTPPLPPGYGVTLGGL